jgi:hypothetical protein
MSTQRLLVIVFLIVCFVPFGSLNNAKGHSINVKYNLYLPIVDIPPSMPLFTTSCYVNIMDPNEWFDLGCELGTNMPEIYSERAIFITLQFGKPALENGVYGVKIHDSSLSFYSFEEVSEITQNFAFGYGMCVESLSTAPLFILGIGLNNFGEQVNLQHGIEWAHAVLETREIIRNTPFGFRTTVVGAADIELAFNSSQNTLEWVNGYLATNTINDIYYYGAIEGCPRQAVSGSYDGDCSTASIYAPPNECGCFEWRQSDVWDVVVNNGRVTVIPQIYNNNGDNAKQWYHMALYGYRVGEAKRLKIFGSFTQYQACQQINSGECEYLDNTPREGWQQLLNELRQNSLTSIVPYFLSDIKWQNP